MPVTIQGRYTSAKCFTVNIEPEAFDQIQQLCNQPFAAESKIRIMPDVHAGKGCTIGTTMTFDNYIAPSLVGVDIGCGMYVVELGKQKINLKKFDDAVHEIPSGFNVWDRQIVNYDLMDIFCPLKDKFRIKKSIGTLGGGNHFIEIDVDTQGNQYLIIHSGSRSLGKQVAEYYQKSAFYLNMANFEYYQLRDATIDFYKIIGHQRVIPAKSYRIAQGDKFMVFRFSFDIHEKPIEPEESGEKG